jgi:antitoxin (DNA-binding transcriptional repressor) of toxin-antitoxin stability system
MNTDSTISLQEVRKDPLEFLRRINTGKTLTVIYHSKPFATVMSADSQISQSSKSTKRMLEYAELARRSAKLTFTPNKSYKELYDEDAVKKYDIS